MVKANYNKKLAQNAGSNMEFRPCIDLHNGKVKQIVGATLCDDTAVETNFESTHDAAYYARMYRRDGLSGGHVIKLGNGNEDAARRALAAWPGGLQLGGGVNADNAAAWLDAGASQVIVTSYVFIDGVLKMERLEELRHLIGCNHLVLDLSCRYDRGHYYIVTDRWQKFTSHRIDAETLMCLGDYCCEFLVHAVDVEGKQAGIDTELISLLAIHSPVPCIYAGGIHTLDDIRVIEEMGRGKMHFTAGSALDIFGGDLSYITLAELYSSQGS